MATGSVDLWPDLEVESVRTPATILKEQAEALSRKTKNQLQGRVDTVINGNTFIHTFNIVAPLLHGYEYELFRVQHSAKLYPIKVPSKGHPALTRFLKSEKEFLDWLRETLSSQRTKNVLYSLLSRSA